MNIRLPSLLQTDQILLVKAALWPADEALTYWQHWKTCHAIDETALLQDAELLPKVFDPLDYDSQMLMSQVYHNLQHTDDALVPRLRGFYRYTWLKSESAWQSFKQAAKALTDGGLEPVWVQGSAVRAGYGQYTGGRRLQDAALCLPLRQQSTALAFLQNLGWQAGAQTRWDDARVFKNEQEHTVLLQRTLLPFTLGQDDEAILWQQTQRITLPDGTSARLLSPTHQVFCFLVWAFWQRATPHLRLIADCVAIARYNAIQWTAVLQLAKEYNATYAVSEGLKLLVADFDIQLTVAEAAQLKQLAVNDSQRLYHRYLKEHQSLPRTARRTIRRVRLEYQAYRQKSGYPLSVWLVRKAAIWGIRRLS